MRSSRLERLWKAHTDAEFVTKDLEATMATMVKDPYVNHVPTNAGARGQRALRAFYRDVFIPSWPPDVTMELLNRVVGPDQLVDELRATFTHSQRMDWFLPNVPPTHRKVTVDFVAVIGFRGDKIATERIYWDQASVLRQVGLLK
jgi:carboxymethylenebutenolidase